MADFKKKISLFFYQAKELLKYTCVFFAELKKLLYYSTKQTISLNILGLLCKIEEINIFIILPSIKNSLNILGLLCRFEEINIFIILPSKKDSLNILGLCRIEKKALSFYQAKNLLKYTGSPLQNWRNKYFYYSTKHKKLFKNPRSSLQIWRNKYLYYSTKQKKNP